MPVIGEFKETEYGYRGEIGTPEKVSTYELHRNEHKESENHPDYIILSLNGARVGAAWDRENRETGAHDLSYDIDDPTRSQRLLGNMSLNERTGNLDAYYVRDRGENRSVSRGPSAPQSEMDGPPQESMPDFSVPSNGQDRSQGL